MGKKLSDYLKLNIFKGDKGLWMIYFFLCVISIVEIYSASSNLTFRSGHHWDPVINQAMFLFVGFLIILLMNNIPCKYFKLIPVLGLPAVILMLLYVLVMQRGVNDASRWMDFFGIRFQPSELAKSMLILQVAFVLSKVNQRRKKGNSLADKQMREKQYKKSFWIIIIITGVVLALIAPENFSTAGMIGLVIYCMMYIGNIPLKMLLKLAGVLALIAVIGVLIMMVVPEDKLGGMRRALTWKHRIEAKLGTNKPDETAGGKKTARLTDEDRQVKTSHIAIANSNVIGMGVGNSIERDFLPHAESDFIYSIIVEETGIFGGLAVMLLYVSFFVRVWRIAQRSDKFFPAYLSVGLALMMLVQALVNMAVAVGLAPVTGQTLPLISHGGTSILITSFNIGMILSVSRYVDKVTAEQEEREAEELARGETGEFADAQGMD